MDIDIDIINSYQFVVGVVDCYGLIVLVPESINFGRILSHTLLPSSLPPSGSTHPAHGPTLVALTDATDASSSPPLTPAGC